ncbi:hypothetical protein GA0061105_101301 [Rhizobium aethiopicum]|uniref:Uncharacterized protein n=1 Tax=Rhizobium aethiopicum TaxID=1138170 RepID=A0A1C3XW37_9HYPH|nr:hypothetical protein GA0061105_101301 [Rhizobium aethiopicum]
MEPGNLRAPESSRHRSDDSRRAAVERSGLDSDGNVQSRCAATQVAAHRRVRRIRHRQGGTARARRLDEPGNRTGGPVSNKRAPGSAAGRRVEDVTLTPAGSSQSGPVPNRPRPGRHHAAANQEWHSRHHRSRRGGRARATLESSGDRGSLQSAKHAPRTRRSCTFVTSSSMPWGDGKKKRRDLIAALNMPMPA